MQFFLAVSLALATTSANAHAIFQKLSLNSSPQPSLSYLRAPATNNPVQDPSSPSLVCGEPGTTSSETLSVSAGDTLGAWYQHVIGGPQGSNDADNPIASSHKGPVTAYMAAAAGSDAVSADATSVGWFKIWEDTFDTSTRTWGVDNLIANDGWVEFAIPECLAEGDYLLRVEIAALHSAYSAGGAQFYSSCAQLSVAAGGSGGSSTVVPGSTVKIPGVYASDDPSIVINIYGSSGNPDLDGEEYPQHGPEVFSC